MNTLKRIALPVTIFLATATLLSACYVETRPAWHPYHREVVVVRR